MTITDFKKLKAFQLKRLKSCEVYSDGEYLFTFVNGMLEPSGYLRTQTEFNSQTANSVGGQSLEEILGEPICQA
ncbi:MAG: hypothetical protein CMI54_02950 [Parcubacteria group bacterium]|nr:hypothetical protein [Parcubacteria group bacterium]